MAASSSNSTWAFILKLVSYICTAIAGAIGGAAI